MIRVALVAVALLASTARADDRGYELHNAEAKRPAPLVVALHCYGCSPTHLLEKLGLDGLAKKHGFVVAIPAGRSDSHDQPFWNATPACCDFDGRKPDDVTYITRVIDELVKQGIADPKRVYLVGFSNGGFLAHRLACEQSTKIAAIVSIGGAAPATCNPSSPVSVLEVHGQADDTVPIAGGKLGRGLPQRVAFPSAREMLGRWARKDQCMCGEICKCPHNSLEIWELPGGHWPTMDNDFAEHLWQWLDAQHK